jgi:hypothetical protein
MSSRIARATMVVVLIALLSGCQMTVRITTHLNSSGGGTLTLGMVLDKELRDTLEGGASGNDLSSVEDLFGRLHDRGWTVTRTEPAGGLDIEANKTFKDSKAFDAALQDLRSGSPGQSRLGSASPAIGYSTSGSLFRTKSRFTGVVDTTSLLTPGAEKQVQQLLNTFADDFHFEIRAILPGAVSITKGDGTVADNVAIWRPKLGTRLEFSAASSAIKTGAMLGFGIPLLVVLAAAGWFLLGRRQRTLVPEVPVHTARRPEPVSEHDELLAIKPDAGAPVVVKLDEPETVPPSDPTA